MGKVEQSRSTVGASTDTPIQRQERIALSQSLPRSHLPQRAINPPSAGQCPQPKERRVQFEKEIIRVPTMSLAEFHEKHIDKETYELLVKEGFTTVAALLEISESTLKETGLKMGQIAELKSALRTLLLTTDDISIVATRDDSEPFK
ncbi:hypothetical protein B0H14DRAFT_2627249 [Mycena olivaceomarginata]|nr:hypothetical protein B0H14DRAFT_2627249 [Mycena olivaceomarginata]